MKVDNCDYGSWSDLIASQRAMSAAIQVAICIWGGNSVSIACRSYSRAKSPAGTSAGAFPMEHSLCGEDPRGPRRGAKGSCDPGTPWVSSPGSHVGESDITCSPPSARAQSQPWPYIYSSACRWRWARNGLTARGCLRPDHVEHCLGARVQLLLKPRRVVQLHLPRPPQTQC